MTAVFTTLFVIVCPTEQPVRVTVVIVLASTQDIGVDPKLAELAKEVQKREPKLIGFQLVAAEAKSIVVGDSYTFDLIDKQELKVKVEKPRDANGRISLTMNGPGVEKLAYGCACDKFFPIVTSHQTKKGEVLILAVMAKPCTAGKPQKMSWVPWRD
jgi:hypothetical protein